MLARVMRKALTSPVKNMISVKTKISIAKTPEGTTGERRGIEARASSTGRPRGGSNKRSGRSAVMVNLSADFPCVARREARERWL